MGLNKLKYLQVEQNSNIFAYNALLANITVQDDRVELGLGLCCKDIS